ncbi:UNVERIFIED_CONTAM: hypothetical protein NCL1_42574 [Trichonephila clavipes]
MSTVLFIQNTLIEKNSHYNDSIIKAKFIKKKLAIFLLRLSMPNVQDDKLNVKHIFWQKNVTIFMKI